MRADDFVSELRAPSLMDTPDGPKERLRRIGVTTDVWGPQFYQGLTSGDGAGVSRYGGKMDAFLKVDAEKRGLWSGLHLNAQEIAGGLCSLAAASEIYSPRKGLFCFSPS